jgi:hypothetical protein
MKRKRKKRKTRKNPGAPSLLGLAVAGGIGYLLYRTWKAQEAMAASRYPIVRL